MTVAPIPLPQQTDSSGLGDSSWITDCRDQLRDYPTYTLFNWQADGTNGVVAAGAIPLKLGNPPINDGSLSVTDNGTSRTVITSGTPTGSQVLVNYDTAELTFATPPVAGHQIAASFQSVKWRDGTIERELYGGLRAMFPQIGMTYVDESINIQVNQWDYGLPVWAQTPGARISRVEVRDPNIITEPWRPLAGAMFRVGFDRLHIPWSQRYSPVAFLRITGWGPFMTLGDLPIELYELPLLYAKGRLMMNQDTFRLREDTMVPLTQEGGQQPGLLTSSGQGFMNEFRQRLQEQARSYGPPEAGINQVSTYDRERYF